MEAVRAAAGHVDHANLVELSVVLVATSNNPSIINPDFLVRTGIVCGDRKLQGDPVATPVFSQIVYEGGLIVRSDPERVMFVQTGSGPSLADGSCPNMAETYVRSVPHVPYRAVGINPKLYVAVDDGGVAKVANVLDDRGSWLSFKDSEPEIQLKAIYPFGSRKIIMEVGAVGRHPAGQPTPGLLFQANVHRDVDQTSAQQRMDALISIFHHWESDVLDCRELTAKFIRHSRGLT